MSFSVDVKEEIVRYDLVNLREKKSLLSSLARINGTISMHGKDVVLEIRSENAKIAKLLNCDEFSFAFRYPTDKKSNKLYMNDLSAIKKDEIIEKMKQCMDLSLFILLKHEVGVIESLKIRACVLEKFKKDHTS